MLVLRKNRLLKNFFWLCIARPDCREVPYLFHVSVLHAFLYTCTCIYHLLILHMFTCLLINAARTWSDWFQAIKEIKCNVVSCLESPVTLPDLDTTVAYGNGMFTPMHSSVKLQSPPHSVLFFHCVMRFITNRKYAFFCINYVRLSPDNHNPNSLY